MLEIRLIEESEFRRVRRAAAGQDGLLPLIADMCRANTLASVMRAGSGHLGSSLSSIDIVTWLYYREMNTMERGFDHPDRDIYFSSKGHDAPAFYSVLHSLGVIPAGTFMSLRRLGGTHGHPDLGTEGVEANTGSLGMGISKARGMALARRLSGAGGRLFVMTGDGELQEGQIWESLQTASHQSLTELTVIVDRNRIQSDRAVAEIVDLGDLERKFSAFGWHVARCDGHDFGQIGAAFDALSRVTDRPKVLIADTVKGRGISFMEGPASLAAGNGLYGWHSGAPDGDAFERGWREITGRIAERLATLGLSPLETTLVERRERNRVTLKSRAEKVVAHYGQALLRLGEENPKLVVLDADLSADCGLRPFETAFPERFVENGIAEQDMVSVAGGLALQGYLPVVNSFGVFLAARANEQIYNNATEETRIIYVCHYAGLLPAGPGKSHQSLRDASLFGALPGMTVLEPGNGPETELALAWCVNEAPGSCMIRLAISPSPGAIRFGDDYRFQPGRGNEVAPGRQGVLLASGPVMLHEALLAREHLAREGISLRVIGMPWINRVDGEWLERACNGLETLFVLENHAPQGALGSTLVEACNASSRLRGVEVVRFAVQGHPACGTPPEVLAAHGLDGASVAARIRKRIAPECLQRAAGQA
ncbi:MAG TPA: 1-deoxy-D-xylulose-5-phosphate synthase [Sedimenticola sp.]|nr:1-deoxy-D-xylulose-5-phosphate synthase [Sedimenticola sp.]